MVYIIIGTKAQLIKMAPIMLALKKNNVPYRYISTGQHQGTMSEILDDFGLPGADVELYSGKDVTGVLQMLVWATKLTLKAIFNKEFVFGKLEKKGVVLVHGDTLSTLLGAVIAKSSGLFVGHVESGLRSFRLFHPFPEEITRLLTFRLGDMLFCPGDWALRNVASFSAEKLDIKANTIWDALKLAEPKQDCQVSVPWESYGIVSTHRFENICTHSALLRVVGLVEYIAERYPLVMVLHAPTVNSLKRFGLWSRLEQNPRILLHKRVGYFKFIGLIRSAAFVVTDGGSNQEECAYMGKPVLLLRDATERDEGMGVNCMLSHYQQARAEYFLNNLSKFQKAIAPPEESPSDLVVHHLKQFLDRNALQVQ